MPVLRLQVLKDTLNPTSPMPETLNPKPLNPKHKSLKPYSPNTRNPYTLHAEPYTPYALSRGQEAQNWAHAPGSDGRLLSGGAPGVLGVWVGFWVRGVSGFRV